MAISRRSLLKLLGTAGVSISAKEWMLSRLQTYANDRLEYEDVRGRGIVSFSRTVCRDCANHCSLAVHKVDELPVGLRGTPWHPATLGALCAAGSSQMQALLDPDRLGKPLMRDDAGAVGRAVEWDEAIGALRARIGGLLSSGAGERLAVVDGRTPSLGTRLLESWVRSIPGARYIPLRIERAFDHLGRQFLGGGPEGRLRLDLARAGTLLLVGNELLEVDGSPVTQMRAHGDRRDDPHLSHAPTLYLGPRQSPTAVKSDYWIPCRPGQERSVLLALAEALGKEHPRRASILPEYARWVSEARDPVDFARRYAVENVAQREGLVAEDLETAVRALQQGFGPGVVLPGPGVLRRPHGAADVRAALALNLWTGGLREAGGIAWGRDPLADLARRLGIGPTGEYDAAALLGILTPLFEIRRSPVDVLLCVEANLVHELPGQDQVARALSHVPFVASFSTHEDETSRVAHVTVPTLLDLESWDLPAPPWGTPEAALQVQRPAVVPAVDARPVEDVILELDSAGVAGPRFSAPGKTMQEVVEAAIGIIVKRGRGELVGTRGRKPLGLQQGPRSARSLLSGESVWVAQSASGPKAAGRAAVVGEPPLPIPAPAPDQLWLVPFDSPMIQGGRALSRPMMMEMSGFLHGLAWESWVEIHPADARRRGISHGDRVKIRGPRAEISSRAVVTRSVVPKVVAAPVGFGREVHGSRPAAGGANPLKLPFAVMDAESGAPAWGPVPVFVVKA